MITINQYIKVIEGFFNKHNIINTVLVGNNYDFNAVSNVIYPVVNIEYITENIQPTNIATQFEITIADLFDPNVPKSEYSIYSDCNQIANDCLSFFGNQYDVDYDINENVSIQKFVEGNDDRTAGCVFILTFNQFRTANDCIIPYNINYNYPIPVKGFPYTLPFVLGGEAYNSEFTYSMPLNLS